MKWTLFMFVVVPFAASHKFPHLKGAHLHHHLHHNHTSIEIATSLSIVQFSTTTQRPSASSSIAQSPTATSSSSLRYGTVIDAMDTAPDPLQPPPSLPERLTTSINVTGKYTEPFVGALGGSHLLMRRDEYLNIIGQGYFVIRWEVAWFNRIGELIPPTWTNLRGRLFHVASGGGRRMTDAHDSSNETYTWMGPENQRITLPKGYQQMWQNEYYYIDGSVTLHQNEGYADYNLGFNISSWQRVSKDINQTPDGGANIKRYGIVRDTGDDGGPAPQFLTRQDVWNCTLVDMSSSLLASEAER